MGYRARVYKLTWPEGHEFHGLEIKLSGMNAAELRTVRAGSSGDATAEERQEVIDQTIATFASHLLSWNYEDHEGNPIPATAEGVDRMDLRILLPACTAWAEEVARPAAPLSPGSSSGPASPEPSAVMDLPLPSPLS